LARLELDGQLLEADACRVDLEFSDGHDFLVPLVTDIHAESFQLIDQDTNLVFVLDGPAVAEVFEGLSA
jgi:hypothetical protein